MSARTRAERIEEIFHAVHSLGHTDARTQLLDQLCGQDAELRQEVDSLVRAADRAGGFLSIAPEAVRQLQAKPLDANTLLDERFGPYRLLRVLEHGGMGVVFLAERADGHYDQQVAIKFVKYGLEAESLIERFHQERQILANLKHPNVARLLDGGTSADGYPYLVMEYIQGEPIDVWCRNRQLSSRAILRLFHDVCEAVQHAHQSLVVHCDLKPQNILVTAEGIPKLLDFGISKFLVPAWLDVQTKEPLQSLAPLTPEFAAPEQFNGGQITTATDVYALGNILYRLLCDAAPYDSTSKLVAEIPLPSSMSQPAWRKHLIGDVDAIVMKALHRDPSLRYHSALQLCEDINNYLGGFAICARKATFGYTLGKFTGRHALGISLVGLALASLLISATLSTWQWQIANAERQLTEQRCREVRTLINTIVFELPKTISELPGSTALRERLLNQGVAYLDRLSQEPGRDAGLQRDLASAYHQLATLQGNPLTTNLGNVNAALANYDKSIAMREALVAQERGNIDLILELAASYSMKSVLHGTVLDDLPQARELTDRCMALLRPHRANATEPMVRRFVGCHTSAAHWANVDADHGAAQAYLEEAMLLLDTLPRGHGFPQSVAGYRLRGRMHEEWAEVAAQKGQQQLAVDHERSRLELWLQIPDTTATPSRLPSTAYHGLAGRLAAVGELHEARKNYHKALARWQQWQARYPGDVGATQAVAVVQAELAELLLRLAMQQSDIKSKRHLQQQACQSYRLGIERLATLNERRGGGSGGENFANRYSWSPSASVIHQRHDEVCRLAKRMNFGPSAESSRG